AALAAVAGLAWGLRYTNIDFRMGFIAGLKAFTAAVLGGIGNINGAVVGGLVLGLVEGMATLIPGTFGGSAWKDVWGFVLVILVLVFRPQGLLGARGGDGAWRSRRSSRPNGNNAPTQQAAGLASSAEWFWRPR